MRTIRFSDAFIVLVLGDKKTQTRRYITPQPYNKTSVTPPRYEKGEVVLIQDTNIQIKINSAPIAEKLNDISREDCYKEGCPRNNHHPIYWFKMVWDSFYSRSKKQWNRNPWVWVYNFERIGNETYT